MYFAKQKQSTCLLTYCMTSDLFQMKVIIRNKTSIEAWIEEKVRMLFGSSQKCGVHCLQKCILIQI